MNAIITAPRLAEALSGDRPPVLLDVRWQLGGPPGRPEYDAGHLPGHATSTSTPNSPPARPGGPPPAARTARLRRGDAPRRGRPRPPVVVYDGGTGWAAARAWWLLRWAGHPSVTVLDGGLAAWTADGGALTTDVPAADEGDFVPEPGALPTLSADEAAALARRGVLLDARAAERYRGDVEPIDRVGGHIPGAVSAPTSQNVAEDGRLLPAARLAERFTALGAAPDAEVGSTADPGLRRAPDPGAGGRGHPGGLVPGLLERMVRRPGPPGGHGSGPS
ncbi:rhodanese-like domain-containing protein [Streptomyces sp. M19]